MWQEEREYDTLIVRSKTFATTVATKRSCLITMPHTSSLKFPSNLLLLFGGKAFIFYNKLYRFDTKCGLSITASTN